jgi:hypothetical protein
MFKKLAAVALFASIAIGASASPALADTHKFTIENKGGHQIDRVYLSAISNERWGRDQMGDDVIAPGDSQSWDIDTDCEMDVKVVYHDGTTKVKDDVDTCKFDLVMDY